MSTATELNIQAIAEEYSAAWAARDPERIALLHAEDTEFWLHLGTEPVRGREAVRAEFANIFEQFPNYGFETYRMFFGADHWVLDWVLTADLPEADGGVRPIRFDCVDIVTVTPDGLVQRKDTFIDAAQMNAALGLD